MSDYWSTLKMMNLLFKVIIGFIFFILLTSKFVVAQEVIKSPLCPSSNFMIADDLVTFVTTPNSLLKYHTLTMWTMPTLVFLAVDGPLTKSYEKDFKYTFANMIPVSDQLIFDTLKGLYVMNTVWKNDDLNLFLYAEGEAILDAYFVSQSLKHVFGRQRPLNNDNPYNWGHIAFQPNGRYTSFPSTHSTVYFAASTVLGKSLKNELLGDFIGLIAFFSLTEHYHWASDIWVGYLLGKSIGNFVWDRKSKEDLRDQWWVYPTFYPNEGTYYPVIGVLRYF